MNKIFKKIAASIMAVTALTVSVVGMSANASRTERNGSYTTLTSDREGSAVTATLTVKSNVNTPRYGQVSIAYTDNGKTTYYTNQGVLAYNLPNCSRSIQKYASQTYNTIRVYSAIYYDSSPYGTVCESLSIDY